jgi:hypothetical protein
MDRHLGRMNTDILKMDQAMKSIDKLKHSIQTMEQLSRIPAK